MSPHDRPVYTVIGLTGISALVTQLLIMRECIARFSGNEFVIALILFVWLFVGGLGNRLSRFIHRRILPATKTRLAWLSLALAAAPVFQIYAIRCLRDVFFIHGSEAGFYSTFFFIFLSMAPYALLVGIALPYSLLTLSDQHPENPGTLVYMTDNLGNIIGGILFTFILVLLPGPSWSILITSSFLLWGSCFLVRPSPGRKWVVRLAAGLILTLLFSGILLEKPSLVPMEGKLAYYKESRYGRITVHQDRELHTVFSNGSPVFTGSDVISAEEAVHYPLSQVDRPSRVLFVSARAGMMAEIEKYGPIGVDYVELNPDITEVLFHFNLLRDQNDFSNIIHMDPRHYLAKTCLLYDAIIINLPDPVTFRVNRFFTDRFFSTVKTHLAPGGIFSFSAPGYENYMSEPMRQKLSSLFNTVSEYFPHVVLIPGNRLFFLCRDRPIDMDIPGKLRQKNVATQYVGPYFHGNVTPERVDELNGLMDADTRKNKDLFPHLIRLMMDQWFAVHQTSPTGFIIGTAVLLIACLAIFGRMEFILFTTGFATMGMEILTVFAVQIFFGYIYSQIGLIMTVFLAGLLPGAWIGNKWPKEKRKLLFITEVLLIALMLVFVSVTSVLKTGPHVIFFHGFGLLVSLVCGCQFPLALHLLPNRDTAAVRSFSADLTGAAFGVLLTSVFFIPWFGIIGAVLCLIGIKCLSLAAAMGYHHQ
jgi:spermidine synthase